MARPSIVDVDYHHFRRALQQAIDTGTRIDRAEKDRWADWVRANHIKEGSFKAFAGNKYQGLTPVIIDDSGEWRGYYLFSEEEEAVLKWERAAG